MKESDQIKLLLELYKLDAEGNGAEAAAKKIEEKLDPSLLDRYLKLKERKGTAVAILKDNICSGCNMTYPETHSAIIHDDFLHSCEFCGRFLVNGGDEAEDK